MDNFEALRSPPFFHSLRFGKRLPNQLARSIEGAHGCKFVLNIEPPFFHKVLQQGTDQACPALGKVFLRQLWVILWIERFQSSMCELQPCPASFSKKLE